MTSPDVAPEKEYKEPPRIAPKIGLEAMKIFLMDKVHHGTRRDGLLAKEAYVHFTGEELEILRDIADTLDYFRINRMHAKISQRR